MGSSYIPCGEPPQCQEKTMHVTHRSRDLHVTFTCKYSRNNVVGSETTVPIWYSSIKSNILKSRIENCYMIKRSYVEESTEQRESPQQGVTMKNRPSRCSLPKKEGVPKAVKKEKGRDFMKNHKIKVPEHPEKMT